jgi:hypothetical protein
MISINLPSSLERHFWNIVEKNYNGDPKAAMSALLGLHDKYGWKEQLLSDVRSVRKEIRRQGGKSSKEIEEAIRKHRKELLKSSE